MKKYNIILPTFVATVMMVSCQNEDFKPSGTDAYIGISSVGIAETAESRSSLIEVNELPPVKVDGNIINITEIVTPIETANSRATEKTRTDLQNDANGFTLHGYVKGHPTKPDKFMESAKVTYNGNTWNLDQHHKWINERDHYFWAHYGTPTDFAADETNYANASFKYTNTTGEEDLLFAQHTQHFSETSGVEGEDKTNIKELKFSHALANIDIDVTGIKFMQPSEAGSTTYNKECSADRIAIPRVATSSYTIGKCAIENGEYKWTELSAIGDTALYIPGQNQGFIIPQAKYDSEGKRVLKITIWDKSQFETETPGEKKPVRVFTIPVTFENGGVWEAGKKYTYKLTGQFNMPYAEQEIKVDPKFTGNKWANLEILKGFNAYGYVKQFTLEWTGVPTTTGNGTYAGVMVLPNGTTPKETDVHDKGNTWKADYKYLGWSYNANTKQLVSFDTPTEPVETIIKGTYNATTGRCSATFNLDATGTYQLPGLDIKGATSIWLVYFGGDNSAAGWVLKDIVIKDIIYK